MQPDNTKQCTKCLTAKPLNEFLSGKHWCSECRAAYQKQYYAANKEALIQYGKNYAAENREKVGERVRRYAASHADQEAQRKRLWYEANREKVLANCAAWVSDNRERRQNYRKEYWKRNRERLSPINRRNYQASRDSRIATGRAWAKANPDSIKASKHKNKAKRKKAEGSYTGAEWTALKKRFQNRCVCCGNKHSKDDPFSKITPDHVVPLARGGTNFIDNLQPMCCHCNSKKSAHHTTDYRKTPFTGTGQMKLIG